MQDGDLAPGVPLWRRHIEVNGVARVASSMSWGGELSSDMPDAIGGVTGIQARTGRIAWVPQSAVESVPPSPWSRRSGWPPSPGDRIDIWVGDDDTSWKVFTGRIDKTTGDVDSLVSTIVDDSDRLNRPISIEPVAYQMPGMMQSNGIYREYAPVYVRPWYAMYKCLRLGGWGVSVPRGNVGFTSVSVDFQGSLYPDLGALARSSSDPTMAYGAGFTYLSSGSVGYEPRAHAAYVNGDGVRVWLRWTGSRAVASIRFSDTRTLRFSIVRNASGSTTMNAQASVGGSVPDGGTLLGEVDVNFQVDSEDESQWIELFFPANSQTIRYTVPSMSVPAGTPNGNAEGSFTLGYTFNTGTTMEYVAFGGTLIAARVGNLTVATWRAMSSHTTASRVRHWGMGLGRLQRIQRTIENRSAADVLGEGRPRDAHVNVAGRDQHHASRTLRCAVRAACRAHGHDRAGHLRAWLGRVDPGHTADGARGLPGGGLQLHAPREGARSTSPRQRRSSTAAVSSTRTSSSPMTTRNGSGPTRGCRMSTGTSTTSTTATDPSTGRPSTTATA